MPFRLVLTLVGTFSLFAQTPELLDLAGKVNATLSQRSARSIAVLRPVSDQAYANTFGDHVAARVSILLANRGFQLASRQAIAAFVAELGLASEAEDTKLFAKLKEKGIQAVVASSFQVTESSVLLDAQVVSLDSGNLIGGHSIRIPKSPEIIQLLGQPMAAVVPQEPSPAALPPPFSFKSMVDAPANADAVTPVESSRADIVALPPSTLVRIRLIDQVSTETHLVGASFLASLHEPIVLEGRVIAPKGVDVTGNRIACPGNAKEDLCITLTNIKLADRLLPITTVAKRKRASASSGGRASQAAGLGALGAIIGAAAGGAKGAAIGGAAGATVGAASGGAKSQASLPSETLLDFQTR